MSKVVVSIVIPTINRYPDLENTINDLLQQEFSQGYEVIIIDQSTPSNEALYQKYEGVPNLYFLTSNVKSASASRNIGIKKSKGEVILFIDDDVIIKDKNFIQKHYRHYQDPSITGVFGCPLELEGNKKKIYTRHRMSYLNAEAGWLYFPSNYGANTFVAVGRSNNLSVRKEIAVKVKGMDENYEKGAHREEGDFCLRVHRNYGPFLFDPQACLIHIGNQTGGIRSWNDSKFVRAKHNMVGAIYFDLKMAPLRYNLLYYHATLRYLFLNKTTLIRPKLWFLTTKRVIGSFIEAFRLLISGSKYMN